MAEIRQLSAHELDLIAGGQGGSQAICASAATLAGYGVAQATNSWAAGVTVGLAINQACNTALNGSAPGGDTAGYGNGSADGNGGGGQVGGDGA